MLKKRFNLRILATIVACLAVTAVFASCDKDSSDDDDIEDKRELSVKEQKLVGVWESFFMLWNYSYQFKADGTFQFHEWKENSIVYSTHIITKGNWQYSDDVIYMTNIKNAMPSELVTFDNKWDNMPNNSWKVRIFVGKGSWSGKDVLSVEIYDFADSKSMTIELTELDKVYDDYNWFK